MIRLYDILKVASEDLLKLVERISDDTFMFDGVKYYCRDLDFCLSRGLVRKLLTSSKVLSGVPYPNVKSYLFIVENTDKSINTIITTDKYWKKHKTIAVYCRDRFELLVIQKRIQKQLKDKIDATLKH